MSEGRPASQAYLPPGWTRQQVQAPIPIVKLFRAAADESGHGGVKTLGTAALALVLGLPTDVRDRLLAWVELASRRDPGRITPEDAWKIVNMEGDAEGRQYIVDRILDPEVTPEPGKKKSDKENGNNGRKAG